MKSPHLPVFGATLLEYALRDKGTIVVRPQPFYLQRTHTLHHRSRMFWPIDLMRPQALRSQKPCPFPDLIAWDSVPADLRFLNSEKEKHHAK